MNFYKHFLGDYARDTAHLSMIEHGAYRVLLDTCYATAKPLPSDNDSLYRIAKAFTAAERKAVDSVADQFFPVNGDGFRHNQRADAEIASAKAYADAQSLRAQKRWDKQTHMPAHKQMESPNDASHSHSQKRSKALGQTSFVRFWMAYPRKTGKQAAAKAWGKLSPDEELQDIIMNALEAQKQSRQWSDQQFIPHPATWLTGRRWEDEISETKPRMGQFSI